MVLNEIEKECTKKILEDEAFINNYLYSFLDRFVYTTADIEKDIYGDSKTKVIEDLLKAFNIALNINGKINAQDIQSIANIINEYQGHQGFRKINVSAGEKANWMPVSPREIYPLIYSALDNYYNIWSALENTYEKEARLHITLMRIHPLEDGNKRLSKILLNANLIKAGLPPVIIDELDTDEYYNFLNQTDYEGFAKFIARKSKSEYYNIIALYKAFYNIPINESVINHLDISNRSI